MKNLVLGVDIGTSSVKIIILNKISFKIEYESCYSTNSAKIKSIDSKFNEQDVSIIVTIVKQAFDKIPFEFFSNIEAMQLCGQMHGLVLWNKITRAHSNLITWQDERCDDVFLSSLPVKSLSDLNSGYGCASLFWLFKNNQIAPDFDSAGTIQDFLTFLLSGENIMSDQNALSWGFFDFHNNKWQDELFACQSFPSYLLPKTAKAGYKIADYVTLFNSDRIDAKIFNALGDLQASVFCCLERQTDCAQICLSINSDNIDSIELSKSVTCFPFFDDKILLVSASLNGGNVMESFVDMLADWNQNLGIEIDREKIWLNLIEQAKKSNFSVEMSPLFYAERHDKLAYGYIKNLRHDNLNIGNIFAGLCLGLIKNLHSMITKDLILQLKCDRIIATGGAIIRNPVLKKCLQSELGYLPIVYKNATDAAYGSAIFVTNLIK